METKSEKYKDIANSFFKENKLDQAIENYNKAIEIDDKKAVYYANRSFCYLRQEKYGLALYDAELAIKTDPDYIKGYYRRAVAFMSMLNYKSAINDFQHVLKFNKNDKLSKTHLDFCQKILYQMKFAKAIAINEKKPLEFLDVTKFLYKPNGIVYNGPLLECTDEEKILSIQNVEALTNNEVEMYTDLFKITPEFISKLTEHFKLYKILQKDIAICIIKKASMIFKKQKSLVHVNKPKDGKLVVCGDIHGQFFDLCEIFKTNGEPSEKNIYIFNGDIVDRGAYSIECILLLLSYMLCYPNCLYINRGNHESRYMNTFFGFEKETKEKYSMYIFELFAELFTQMPLCYIIDQRIMVVHGGLPRSDGVTLKDIESIDRLNCNEENDLLLDLLWSDPQDNPGWNPSPRGQCFVFGPDVTKRFCELNNLDYIIRSHEVKDAGYEIKHDGMCYTVFSAPNYSNRSNLATVIVLDDESLKPNFIPVNASGINQSLTYRY